MSFLVLRHNLLFDTDAQQRPRAPLPGRQSTRRHHMQMSSETERRLSIWQALSELFLDTELSEVTSKYIARAVIKSEYSPAEVKRILWQEVFPALESNLRSITGVWEGYPREWLQQNITVSTAANPLSSSQAIVDEIASCWGKVCEYLPREYA